MGVTALLFYRENSVSWSVIFWFLSKFPSPWKCWGWGADKTTSANLLFRRPSHWSSWSAARKNAHQVYALVALQSWVYGLMYLVWIFHHNFFLSAATYSLVLTCPMGHTEPQTSPTPFIGFLSCFKRLMRFPCWGSLTVNWRVSGQDFIYQLSQQYKAVTFHWNTCSY